MPTILIRGLEVGVILQQQLNHVNITPCCSIAQRSPISKKKTPPLRPTHTLSEPAAAQVRFHTSQ